MKKLDITTIGVGILSILFYGSGIYISYLAAKYNFDFIYIIFSLFIYLYVSTFKNDVFNSFTVPMFLGISNVAYMTIAIFIGVVNFFN